ncbi:MAG: hypothetical protein DRP45_11450 [Candidatus Zixiibacteriota bacterium]|nr:MAG: hypothetical protein DRP45_11450 [candidate division Zixibacteria bacterium]
MPGKKAQDWSYLTPIRALHEQTGNITDPSNISDLTVVDTTVQSDGEPVARARQQTLVVYVVLEDGATLDVDAARLTLWSYAEWESKICEGGSCPEPPDWSTISASQRWAAIAHAKLDVINTELDDRSLAFVFPWMPAGKYKIAVSAGLTGNAVICEQHTE